MRLANTAASDEGPVRVVLLSAMGALLVVSLAVPGAFGDDALVDYVGLVARGTAGWRVAAGHSPSATA